MRASAGRADSSGGLFFRDKSVIRRTQFLPEVERLAQVFLDIHYFELQDGYQTIKNPDRRESFVTDPPTI